MLECMAKCSECGFDRVRNINEWLCGQCLRRAFIDQRHATRSFSSQLVKRGRIPVLGCEVCGSMFSEIHHEDYDDPWNVRWLCRKHHMEVHGGWGPKLGGKRMANTRFTGTVDGREVVDIFSAVQRFGVSRRTIYNWIDAGRVETIRHAASAKQLLFVDTITRSDDGRVIQFGPVEP